MSEAIRQIGLSLEETFFQNQNHWSHGYGSSYRRERHPRVGRFVTAGIVILAVPAICAIATYVHIVI